eukprot:3938762-Rhodomonas_salina.1
MKNLSRFGMPRCFCADVTHTCSVRIGTARSYPHCLCQSMIASANPVSDSDDPEYPTITKCMMNAFKAVADAGNAEVSAPETIRNVTNDRQAAQ